MEIKEEKRDSGSRPLGSRSTSILIVPRKNVNYPNKTEHGRENAEIKVFKKHTPGFLKTLISLN